MNYKRYKRKFLTFFTSITIVVLFILLYLFNNNFKDIVNLILISFMLAYVIKPMRDLLCSKTKMNKKTSALIVILFVVILIVICGVIIIPDLVNEADNISNIIDEVESLVETVKSKIKINEIPIASSLYNEMNEKSSLLIKDAFISLVDKLINLSSNIVSYAIAPIIIYYFLSDGKKIYDNIVLIVPVKNRIIFKKIIKDIDKKLSRYIISQLLLCVIIGILTFILLLCLKVKFPLWIALLNGVFNIIPYFGPVFGIIPAGIIALLDSPLKCIYVIIGMVIIQQIEGNILSPKITADSTDIHPFIIIVLLLIGEKFGGFIGMIIIVPIAVIIKVLYEDINKYIF